MIGTRYAGVAVRVLVDPMAKDELQQIHSLQDAIKVTQQTPGTFHIPNWDEASRKKVQASGARCLGVALPRRTRSISPSRRRRMTGRPFIRLSAKDVPVDGFWSVTVYNTEGYIEPNKYEAYSVNNYTAVKGPDSSVTVQFGGCDGKIPNCFPIMKGWNYTVRLFRPRPEILDGRVEISFGRARELKLELRRHAANAL
jgi:Protein of unknown function (DUF1214)